MTTPFSTEGSRGRDFGIRQDFLPFFRPEVSDEEIAAVAEVLRSGWLTYGPKVREFGEACRRYLDVPFAVPLNSCSAGLFLALKALGIGPGDEVILPAVTFVASLSAVLHCGAEAILADIDPATLTLDPRACAAALTPRTRAILTVDLGGHPSAMDELMALARPRDIKVVQDAAHSFGAEIDGRRIGAVADATVFSFYATKCITTGDGGLLTCSDPELAERVRLLGFHGMDGNAWQRYGDKGRWYYEIVALGWKFHLGDPAAALGLGQLARADQFMARRTALAQRYLAGLAGVPGLILPAVADRIRPSWHLFILQVDPQVIPGGRDQVIADLTANRIGSSVHFIPLHHHPAFAHLGPRFAGRLANSERYFRRAVSLPLFPGMGDGDVDDVIAVVKASAAAGSD